MIPATPATDEGYRTKADSLYTTINTPRIVSISGLFERPQQPQQGQGSNFIRTPSRIGGRSKPPATIYYIHPHQPSSIDMNRPTKHSVARTKSWLTTSKYSTTLTITLVRIHAPAPNSPHTSPNCIHKLKACFLKYTSQVKKPAQL